MPPRTRYMIAVASLVVAATGSSAALARPGSPVEGQQPHTTPGQAHTAIVGGVPASGSAFPSMVAILVDPSLAGGATSASSRVSCGGALIAPSVVLTAAHCVIDEQTGTANPTFATQVVIGRSDLRSTLGEVIDVAKIAAHPRYNARTDRKSVV